MATQTINVKAKAERGFWRAGLHFTRAGVDLATSSLTKAQLEAIRTEPNLVVTEVGETDAQRTAREKAEAAEAKKADAAAEARLKAATKDAKAKSAWAAAATAAQAAAGLDDAAWAALSPRERIPLIEAALAQGAG